MAVQYLEFQIPFFHHSLEKSSTVSSIIFLSLVQWLCDQTDTMLRAGKKGFLGLRTAPQTSPKLIHFPDLVIVVLHSITCYYLLTYISLS